MAKSIPNVSKCVQNNYAIVLNSRPRIAFDNALEAAERAVDVPDKLREAFKNQATASLEKLKEARDDGFEEEEEIAKPKCGVLEGARAAFPPESRHDACSSFSSKVSLEYGGPDVGRIAVAAQVCTGVG